VTLSFYKIFGYPTGVGALLARHEALERLHRPWFAGGTIKVASVTADRFVFATGASAFEDGTLDFTNIPAVDAGLSLIDGIGYDTIRTRVRLLTGWLLEALLALRHGNGEPLVHVYGPSTMDRRGGTVSFNFYDRQGQVIPHGHIEVLASARGISLRTGCFCNPGAGEVALGINRPQIEACLAGAADRMTFDDLRQCVDPTAAGAVRVSVGLVSNFNDVYALVAWARELLDR
jgi:selenocysteine lyase/cysteine desulfurase